MKKNKKISLDNFYQWFAGFSDGESNFSIIPNYAENGDKILKFNFRFTIGLHIDDKNVLIRIQNLLGVGYIYENNNECKFIVSDKQGIIKLISIFDNYNLNTTKYLDYLDFKKAFNMYYNRNEVLTEQLIDKLIELKNGMNSNRINFDMPSNHIKITTYWLLGLIEGEGSFNIWRSTLVPVFSIVLTEHQSPVIIKIKEFLIQNLGFDVYSIWKLNNTSNMGINIQKARNNSKSSVLFIIKDIRILHRFFIPFFNKLNFQSKKAQDFEDFKLICYTVYIGAHKKDPIKSLILKLSYNMNNFRLSTYSGNMPVEILSKNERDIMENALPLVEQLWDGRIRDISSKKIIYQHESCIYKIITPNGEILIKQTISESADIVGVNVKTLSKYLDVESEVNPEYTVLMKNYKVKRIGVYNKV